MCSVSACRSTSTTPGRSPTALLQVLPLDEGFKAALLETDDVAQFMHELDSVLGDTVARTSRKPREDT
jgi:hypothetical protein